MNLSLTHKEFSDTCKLLNKLAAAFPLKPHQQKLIKRLEKEPGVVAAHTVGSGKSLASIAAISRLGLPALVVVPAALQENYKKELKKWLGKVPKNIKIVSQQSIARKGLGEHDVPGGLLIVDEAHRARNIQSKLLGELQKSKAAKKLFLTATPTYNVPSDIAPLINLVSGKQLLPADPQEFKNKYLGERMVQPSWWQRLRGVKPGIQSGFTRRNELRNILQKYVDVYKGNAEGYPSSEEEVLRVPMSQSQAQIYNTMFKRAPWWVQQKVKWGLPPGKGELAAMTAFLTGPRQVSNTTAPFITDSRLGEAPKVDLAVQQLKDRLAADPRFKAVVYSNFLESGLNPYKEKLTAAGIPFGEFSGDAATKARNEAVKKYNANKLRALLISSAGSEGLDLKGTKLLQILEPHFTEEKEKQIIGRAVRYKSHAGLPPEEQKVHIQRYLAEPRAGIMSRMLGRTPSGGTDEYIRRIAEEKSRLNKELMDLADPSKNPSTFQRLIHPES